MKNKATLVAMIFSLIILGGYISRFYLLQIPLGKDSPLSVDKGTRALLHSLDNPLYIEFVRTPERGLRRNSELRLVEQYLIRIARIGDGMVHLNIIDADHTDLPLIEEAGLTPLIRQGKTGLPEEIYSGIIFTYQNQMETLPLVLNPADLEFQLHKTLLILQGEPLPLITFLSGEKDKPLEDTYSYLLGEIEAVFPIAVITEEDPLPVDTEVLVLMDHKDLNNIWRVNIREYIEEEGKLVLCGTGVSLHPVISDFGKETYSPVQIMLENYGFQLAPVLLGSEQSEWIQDTEGSGAIPYPLWFQAEAAEGILNPLSEMVYLWSSPVMVQNVQSVKQLADSVFAIGEPFPIRPGTNYPRDWIDRKTTYPVAAHQQIEGGGSITVIGSSHSFSDFAIPMGYETNHRHLTDFLLLLTGNDRLLSLRTPLPLQEQKVLVPHPVFLVLWILFLSAVFILLLIWKRRGFRK